MKQPDIMEYSSFSAHYEQNEIKLLKFTGCAGQSASHSRSGWRRTELIPHCHKVKRGRTTSASRQNKHDQENQCLGSHNKTLVLTGGLWYPLTGLVDGCRPQHSSTLCGGKTVATEFGNGEAAPLKQSDIVDCSSSSAHYGQNEIQ